jgi:hypothetical protein
MSSVLPFITDTDMDDDLEYGIESQIQSINSNIDNINEDEQLNPFYVSRNGGNLKDLKWGDIYRSFNHVIIMCLTDHQKPENLEKLFSNKIKKTDINSIKNITYFRTSINILKNRDHFYKSNIISKNDLSKLFQENDFNESEIVLAFFEMNEENTRKYCEMYQSSEDLFELENKMEIYNYYLSNKKSDTFVKLDLNTFFKNMKESEYWSNTNNLDINITHSFIDREFNNQRNSTNNFQVINSKNFKIKTGLPDYPINDVENTEKMFVKKDKNLFVDPSIIIRKDKQNKKRTFYSTNIDNTTINNEYVDKLYNLIDTEKLQYQFINKLLLSKEYCHLVLGNKNLLTKINPIIEKYKHVFKYTIGYAWLTFYLEECLARSKSTKFSRFSFDIETASKLPVFPYIYNDLKQNPYITTLIDDGELINNNTYGLHFIDGYDGYGITNLVEFRKRLNIFMCDNPELNVLEGIDWTKFAISGSLITACLQKRSPLLDQMIKKANNDDSEGFKQFINKYYNDSDVDLMSNDASLIGFLNSVKEVYSLVKKNLNATDKESRYEIVKSFAISITKYFFAEYLKDFNETYGFNKTLEEFEKMTDDILFKTYVYNKYINTKLILNKKLVNGNNIDNIFVKEYMIPNSYDNMNIYKVDADNYENYVSQDSDILYHLNDFGHNVQQKDNKLVMKISENIRIKIFCKNTKIETFRIKDKEFFNTVARFHFPCVRAYYQGDNVHILPSCITAMMTGVNIEYKYFAGIRNPVDIINKYMQRGFSILLNKFELNLWLEYNKNPENKSTIKYDGSENNKKELTGGKIISNKIYNIDNPVNYNNIMTTNEQLVQYYKKYNKNSCIDITKIKTINNNGNINKLYQSFIDLAYEEIN